MLFAGEGYEVNNGRKFGVTAKEGFENSTVFSVDSFQLFGGEKLRNDSVASVDSGIGDCHREVDSETGLEVISLEEVNQHDTREDGWLVIYDKVYQVTEYLRNHPGGEEVVMEYLGYDATLAFRGVGHSSNAMRILEKYLIGILPRQDRLGLMPDM